MSTIPIKACLFIVLKFIYLIIQIELMFNKWHVANNYWGLLLGSRP